MRKSVIWSLVGVAGLGGTSVPMLAQESSQNFPVAIRVNASKVVAPVKPIWRFFGADEPNYATMTNGRALLAELGGLKKGDVYFRTHNLMTTGDGRPALKWGSTNLYTEDKSGRAIYDFRIVDKIFDTYLKSGIHPYVEIGFMPEALSTHPVPYRHEWSPKDPYDSIYTGWAYPPKSFEKWGDAVYHWAAHCVSRYGKAEVEKWYWEVWNEPNIGYWKGSPQEFLRLHDVAIDAVRRALPSARVGGPDTAGGGGFFNDVLTHDLTGINFATGKVGTPTDFVSFHAKGLPTFVDGHVRMGIANQLRAMDEGFAHVASHPTLASTPIVIGESDPDGCAACQGSNLGYRNGNLYASYTAATFPRAVALARTRGVNLQGALTWAFEFEGYDSFAGFRQLATNGVDLPVLNVFRLFSKMEGDEIESFSDHQTPLDQVLKSGVREGSDVGVWATRSNKSIEILVWHYHDDDVQGPAAEVGLTLSGIPGAHKFRLVKRYEISKDEANSYTAWLAMGSPKRPTSEQTELLRRASALTAKSEPLRLGPDQSTANVEFQLPRQGVCLLSIPL